MAGYICVKCESEIDINPVKEKIICPECSGRIILKKRPKAKKTVKAR